jgi:PPM family protein phosphatase
LAQGSSVTRPLRIEAAGGTHVGLLREHNEDNFVVDLDLHLFLVADGIGGAAAGEVASRMAVDLVQACCRDARDVDISQPSEIEPASPAELKLLFCLWKANQQIFDAGMRDARHRGMATTFAGVHADPAAGLAYIAHVGDSRVYRYRRGQLDRLTEDHSLLNEFTRRGEALPEPIDPVLAKSVVTRALGMDRSVEVETHVERPEPGDLLIVCSDGLSGPVPEEEITATLDGAANLQDAVRGLIDRANEHGGPDNVTCVLVRWMSTEDAHGVSRLRGPPASVPRPARRLKGSSR